MDMLPLFENDIRAVPKMALTIGVGSFMDSKEVMVIMTSTRKAKALACCIEDGVSHMSPVSMIQNHRKAVVVCDEDATLDLRVRTVRYFKGLEEVHNEMLGLNPVLQNNAQKRTASNDSNVNRVENKKSKTLQ